MTYQTCAFCQLPPHRIVASNDHALVVRDAYPVSEGHTLVIPRRHVGSFFELRPQEREAMMALLDASKAKLDRELQPDGYNIGINDGPAAGQTVRHFHMHLIPRYKNDVADPRGGVRWVSAAKADYWSAR